MSYKNMIIKTKEAPDCYTLNRADLPIDNPDCPKTFQRSLHPGKGVGHPLTTLTFLYNRRLLGIHSISVHAPELKGSTVGRVDLIWDTSLAVDVLTLLVGIGCRYH